MSRGEAPGLGLSRRAFLLAGAAFLATAGAADAALRPRPRPPGWGAGSAGGVGDAAAVFEAGVFDGDVFA